MGLRGEFAEAAEWTCRYQRNNKRSGLKNLRCFPLCSDAHRLRGFCGRPATLRLQGVDPGAKLGVWACFLKLPSEREADPGLPICTEITHSEIVARTRIKADPFRPWIAGEPADEEPDATADVAGQRTFIFNKGKKGWHYSWVANKHTCESRHVLRAYVFDTRNPDCFRLIAHFDSPCFTIFCRRRQRQNLERLPAQLKAQLELQDAIKKQGGKSSRMPSSIPLTKEPAAASATSAATIAISDDGQSAPAVAAPKQAAQRRAAGSSSTTRKRGAAAAAAAAAEPASRKRGAAATTTASKRARKGKATAGLSAAMDAADARADPGGDKVVDDSSDPSSSSSSGIHTTTYEEKQFLLFHVVRSLMRLDVKSSTPLLSTIDSNDLQFYQQGTEASANSGGRLALPCDAAGTPVHGTGLESQAATTTTATTDHFSSSSAVSATESATQSAAATNHATASSSENGGAAAFGRTFEDISKSVSDCLDCFTTSSSSPLPAAAEEVDHPPYATITSAGGTSSMSELDPQSYLSDRTEVLSTTRSNAGLDLPDLDDFEPFDIDFSVLSEADFTSVDRANNSTNGGKHNFGEIMIEFALFLIEETEFTAAIEGALSSLSNATPDQCKEVAVSVLVDLLRNFLGRYRITVDELYHLFKTQVWKKDDALAANTAMNAASGSASLARDSSNSSAHDPHSIVAASAMIKLEQRPVFSRPVSKPESESSATISKAIAESSFMANITHYTKTVNNFAMPSSPHSPRSNGEVTARFSALVADHSAAVAPASSLVQDEPKNAPVPPVIPYNDPRNDFTGEWARNSESLDILEGIRESIGVPWVLRKMIRHVESNFTIVHGPGYIEIQSNRKLLSSGYQLYILDGKEHPWNLPPPLPTERQSRSASYQATIKGGVLRLALCYSSRKRIMRESRIRDGNCIESIVRFQFRHNTTEPWQDRLRATCYAYRRVPEENTILAEQDGFDRDMIGELAWLSAPSDDFALNLT